VKDRALIPVLAILAVALVGGGLLLLAARPEPIRITINPPPPTATPAPLGVYVTGAVTQPESVVVVPPGSRVEDAINAAGGALVDADLERLNLAAPLRDGDHVHVPRYGEVSAAAGTTGGVSGGALNINAATAEELEALPGIGPALAGRIIAYREQNGNFTSMADLDAVEGIGPSLIGQLEGLIRFD
jgi:competence protein ComEA